MEVTVIPDYVSSVGGSTAATRRAEQAQEELRSAHRGGDEGPAYKQALRTAVKASQQVYRNQLETLIAAAAEYVTALDQTLAQVPDDSPRAQRDEDRAHAAIAAHQQRNLTAEQFTVWEKAHEEARRKEKAHRNALREARDAAADYQEAATYSRKHPDDSEAKKRADEAYARWEEASEQVELTGQAALAAAYNDALAASGDGTVPCTADMAKACIEKLAGQNCGGMCAESKCTCTMYDAYGHEMDREILDPIRIAAERGQAAQAQAEEAAQRFSGAVGAALEGAVERVAEGLGGLVGSVKSGVSKLLGWLEPPGRGEGAKTPQYSVPTEPPPRAPSGRRKSERAGSTRGTFSRPHLSPTDSQQARSGVAAGAYFKIDEWPCAGANCRDAVAWARKGGPLQEMSLEEAVRCLWQAADNTWTAAAGPPLSSFVEKALKEQGVDIANPSAKELETIHDTLLRHCELFVKRYDEESKRIELRNEEERRKDEDLKRVAATHAMGDDFCRVRSREARGFLTGLVEGLIETPLEGISWGMGVVGIEAGADVPETAEAIEKEITAIGRMLESEEFKNWSYTEKLGLKLRLSNVVGAATSVGDATYAVVEGIAYSNRDVLDLLCRVLRGDTTAMGELAAVLLAAAAERALRSLPKRGGGSGGRGAGTPDGRPKADVPDTKRPVSPDSTAKSRVELEPVGKVFGETAESWLQRQKPIPERARGDWADYQRRVCGENKYNLPDGPGEVIDADGIRPSTGTVLEAKYVGDPSSTPYRLNPNIPDHVLDQINAKTVDEFRRYAGVFQSGKTPLRELEVITNHQVAVPYLEGLMRRFGIPGRVVTRP